MINEINQKVVPTSPLERHFQNFAYQVTLFIRKHALTILS